ncbi:hypothetical protein M9H77_24451 [Catharanthus roseus]|uniref:Uncharacterized protein n=1 Tax=Catharanthus roseus TaxID=4058 RepID=A0ACC0AVU5_CATRO|nr:hypothetical protein M9H77_24451 [Catharanthus roseus]
MAETQSFYIPPEIITAILLILPPRALMKFICVCKTWKSLITNPSFLIDYSKISTSKGILVNECLHWFSNSKTFGGKVILSFDLMKEKFNEIGMPNFGDDRAGNVWVYNFDDQVMKFTGIKDEDANLAFVNYNASLLLLDNSNEALN